MAFSTEREAFSWGGLEGIYGLLLTPSIAAALWDDTQAAECSGGRA